MSVGLQQNLMMDIASLCRSCMVELKSTEIENPMSKDVLAMFCFCTNILISEEDTLPKEFCYDCKINIEAAYKFIKNAQNTNITLKNIASRNSTSVIVPNIQKETNIIPTIIPLPNYKLCIGDTDLCGNSTTSLTNTNLIEEIEDSSEEIKEAKVCKDDLKPYLCPVCSKSFMFKTWLTKHMENECSGETFVCAVCSKKFKKKSKLAQHVIIHSQERNHSCNICGRHYKRPQHLASHMQTHKSERPYACDKCPKKFKLKKILQGHMKTHEPVKQYLCSYCGWSNNLAINLECHLRTHTGAKPYACPQCPFRAAAPCSLRRHRLRHAQRRPYVCNRCSKAFYDSSALKRHERTHTGELPYRCAMCARAFPDSWKRKHHLMRAHGLALHDIPRMRRDGQTY